MGALKGRMDSEQGGRSHQSKLVFFGWKHLLCLFYSGGRHNGTIQEVA